jgi:RimJ/RimL family protein N-acetyltransferase
MAELMAAADLAIGAGGSELWERCCMGLPALSICTADNQKKQIADAASEGLLYAPEGKGNLAHFMELHVGALLGNDYLRQFISRNAMHAVDGNGALRVLSELNCNAIEMQEAQLNDSRNIFEWRNHPIVRAGSRNKELISWETHRRWFTRALESPNTLLLIGRLWQSPIGVARFDVKDNTAEVSIYLVPGTEKKGRGKSLLRSAERWLAERRPEIHEIYAYVLNENEPSSSLFQAASYRLESTCYVKRLH